MIKLNYREFCDIPKNKLPLKKIKSYTQYG